LEEVGEHVGVDRATFSRWEKRQSKPRAENLRQLCKTFGMTAQELGFDEGGERAKEDIQVEEGEAIRRCIAGSLSMRLSALAYVLCDFQTLSDMMVSIIEEFTMNMDTQKAQMTRREALHNLVTLPLITMNLSSFSVGKPGISTARTEDILAKCAAGIAACRELSKGKDSSDLALAYDGITAYTPILKGIVKDSPSQHRKTAANLMAQVARMRTMLGRIGWHNEGLRQALFSAQEAVMYAGEADDPALLISSQLSLAWVHYYAYQPMQGLHTLNKALLVVKEHAKSLPAGPSLTARIYNTQAVLEAMSGQSPINMLRKTHEALRKGSNDYFVFTEELLTELTGNEALAYYYARDYNKAADTFGQLIDPNNLTSKAPLSGKGRGEMLNYMTLTALKQKKDMMQTLLYWDAAVESANKLQSKQRFQEVRSAFDIMDVLWSGEIAIEERRDIILH
jgi:transcriptional regulator with XRE-family HTH domain